jgi:hypothetical protein
MTDACGYQKGGGGVCNSTIFGYPFEPLNNMLADTPKDFKTQTVEVIGDDATAFKDSGYNGNATRAASLLTFVSEDPTSSASSTSCSWSVSQ